MHVDSLYEATLLFIHGGVADLVVIAILVNGFGVPGASLRGRFESCLRC